jgi:hypothetical protein
MIALSVISSWRRSGSTSCSASVAAMSWAKRGPNSRAETLKETRAPAPERNDEARLLGDRDEVRGRHVAELLVAPAGERLEADDASARQLELGLEVESEAAPLEGGAQAHLDGEAT